MILGVDHISVSGDDWRASAQELEALGFIRRFAEPGLVNAGEKAPLLRLEGSEVHDIVVLDGCDSPALELTVHGPLRPGSAHLGYVPVMRVRPDVADALPPVDNPPANVGAVLEEILDTPVSRRSLPGLDAEAWVTTGDDTALLATVHPMRNLDASAAFFEDGLGFRPTAAGQAGRRQWRVLETQSPLAKWRLKLMLYTAESDLEMEPLMLDDVGFPCLALLSSAVSTDLAALAAQAGAESEGVATEAFTITVAGKPLQIGLMRGPSGELIELIEVKR